jgi:MarR family transcriptional regulator, organic hydroperoxide resistance regulator
MEINLTVAQLKSLFFISNEGSTNIRKLAIALGVTPANVTGIVDRMLQQDLISRTENSEDRRMLLLQVTDKGRALVMDLRERQMSQLTDVLDNLDEGELAKVTLGLSILLKACELHEAY